MKIIDKKIEEYLLEIKAIKLNPSEPFTWASGWKSPIYCDNRKTLSYPEIRNYLKKSFAGKIKEKYPDVELIAGVATGAIAIGVLVADILDLPFVYVRSSAKEHGLGNQIEGNYSANQKVVVIEDLISTGGSSLRAVDALRNAGCNVLGMLAIFSYEFQVAIDNFKNKNCKLETLGNYNSLIDTALKMNYINEHEVQTLKQWRKNPSQWNN